MSKTKWTYGALCRDGRGKRNGGEIVLYGCLLYGWWGLIAHWEVKEWEAQYDLKPPAPGKCFEVEIEI